MSKASALVSSCACRALISETHSCSLWLALCRESTALALPEASWLLFDAGPLSFWSSRTMAGSSMPRTRGSPHLLLQPWSEYQPRRLSRCHTDWPPFSNRIQSFRPRCRPLTEPSALGRMS